MACQRIRRAGGPAFLVPVLPGGPVGAAAVLVEPALVADQRGQSEGVLAFVGAAPAEAHGAAGHRFDRARHFGKADDVQNAILEPSADCAAGLSPVLSDTGAALFVGERQQHHVRPAILERGPVQHFGVAGPGGPHADEIAAAGEGRAAQKSAQGPAIVPTHPQAQNLDSRAGEVGTGGHHELSGSPLQGP